jgi:hypothetical protein
MRGGVLTIITPKPLAISGQLSATPLLAAER